MPFRKGSSISLPNEGVAKDHHSQMKRKQRKSFEDEPEESSERTKHDTKMNSDDLHKERSRLIRSNDLLTHTTTETLLDLLKDYSGVKESSEETQTHLYMVRKASMM